MKQLAASFVRFVRDERGATAIEYTMIASLIALVIVGALTLLGERVRGIFESVLPSLAG